MKQTENYSRVLEGIAQAQAEIPVMPKDCSGYGYKYTSLETISKTIRPILRKYGIDYIQPLDDVNGTSAITTRIYTIDGKDFIEFTTPLPQGEMAKMNNVQAMGATITYFRRYAICSFLGIIADEDVDARQFERDNARTQAESNPEFQKMKTAILQYEKDEILKGDLSKKAELHIANGNLEGMRNVIAWCEKEIVKQ